MKHVLALLLVLMGGCSPAFAQRFVKTANSWADLLSLNPNDVHTNAFVVYGTTVGDEKGGVFTYFSNSSEATNLQNVFKPYAYNGRWIKQIGNFLTNTYVTNLYASNIYTTNLTVINLTTNYVSTNVTVDTLTVTNFVGESTNITINGVYVIVPNFDPNQFSVLPTATPPLVDVAIKTSATVTNLISHNWLVADDSFAMGATPGNLSATAATNLVPTTSSWVDVTSNSAVPGDRILEMNIGTYNGQLLVIKNAPGGNTFTLPNSSAVSGGGQVNLRGTSWTAEPDESILLIYDEAFQDWYEIGRFGTSTAGLVADLTPGYLPYATGTNTLGDSPLYRASANVLGFGSSTPLFTAYNTTGTTNTIMLAWGISTPPAASSVVLGNTNVSSIYVGKVGKLDSSGNVAWGTDALKATTTNANVAIGKDAMRQATIAKWNVAIGEDTLTSVTSSDVRGNIAIGTGALDTKTSGQWDIGIGHGALGLLVTGGGGYTVLGTQAGANATSAQASTLIGYQAGLALTSGSGNTFVGKNAGLSQTTATGNDLFGEGAAYYNLTGGGNSIFGNNSFQYVTNISKTVVLGQQLQGGTSDIMTNNIVNSVFIGYKADSITNNVPGLTNVVSIGYNTIPTNNNEIVIGNSSNTKAIFPITSFSGGGTKYLSDDGQYRAAYSLLTGNYTDWDYFVPTNYYSGNLASGNTTIFTVPAGKRFLLTSAIIGSTNTAGVTTYTQILTNGNYYAVFASSSVTTNLHTAFHSSGQPQLYVENESYAVNSSATGLNVFVSGFLFSTNSPIKPIRAFNLGTGPAAVYTVPTGYYAVGAFNSGSTYPAFLSAFLLNRSGGARTYSYYVVPNGSSADLTTRLWGDRSVSDNAGFFLVGPTLHAGSALWITSDSATAGQNVIGHVVEVQVP